MQTPLRKLVVVRRERSAASLSLFVRLHPTTAQALWREAAIITATLENSSCPRSSSSSSVAGWNVKHEEATSSQVSSGIEFLPLRIQSEQDDDIVVFASYNGGDMERENAIELPVGLLPNDTAVWVSVVPRVPVATAVTVETICSVDWQRISQHADWLETGGFLQQISLVYVGQEVEITMPNQAGSVARLRILAIDDDDGNNEDNPQCLWPNTDDNVSNNIQKLDTDMAKSSPCHRIVADTELVLLSGVSDENTGLPTFQLQPAMEDYSQSMQRLHVALEASLSRPLISCPRSTIAMNPSAVGWSDSAPYARVAVVGDASQDFLNSILLQVRFSDAVENECVVLHPLTRLSLGLSIDGGKVSVERISPLEWEQATNDQLSVDQEVDFQQVKFVQPNGGFRQPRILSSNALSFDESIGNESEFEIVPVGSFITSTQRKETMPSVFKTKWKSDSKCKTTSKRNEEDFCLSVEHLRRLCDQHARTVSNTQEILVKDSINWLPHASILTQKLLELESKLLQNEPVVLVGKSGSGKTHAALKVAAMSHLLSSRPVVYLDCIVIKNLRRMMDILDALRDAIVEAVKSGAVLILDDLDELIMQDHFEALQGSGAQVQQPNWAEVEQSKLISDHVQRLLLKHTENVSIVITCASTNVASAVVPSRSRQTTLQLPLFDSAQRLDLLICHIRLRTERFDALYEESFRRAVASIDFEGASRSFLPVDLCTLASRMQKSFSDSHWDAAKLSDTVKSELNRFVPVSRDAAMLEGLGSKTTWDDVGGLFQAKEALIDAVFRPSIYRRIYERSRVRLPRGIMLFGPSGCGKSFLVPALARHCRLPLIMCRGPELLDRYIGGSEAKVRELFSRAFLVAPCILFLDEFDALAPKRGSDSTGVTDRVVNQLLTFLDGVEDLATVGTVYIVAATSRPDKIDPALLRPGRLEKHVYVGMPTCREEMIDVITKAARTYDFEDGVLDSFFSSYEWSGKPLSPADVRAAFQAAHLLALRRRLEENSKNTPEEIRISSSFLCEGFSKVRPSLSEEDALWYERLRRRFCPVRNGSSNSDQKPTSPLRTALR